MKKLIPFLLVPTIAAAGAHYYIWSDAAATMEADIERRIASFNEEGENNFSYAAKKVGGYPMQVSITYVQPKLTMMSPMQESLSWEVDGSLTFGGALLQKVVHMTTQGKQSLEISGAYKTILRATSNGAMACSLPYNEALQVLWANPQGLSGVEQLGQGMLAMQGSAHCNIADMQLYHEGTQEPVYEMKGVTVGLSSNPSATAGYRKIGVHMGMESAVAGDAAYDWYLADLEDTLTMFGMDGAAYTQVLKKHPPIPMLDYRLLGSSSGTFALNYDGPVQQGMFKGGETPPLVVSGDIDVKNDLYSMSFPFSFDNSAGGEAISLRLEAGMKATAAYDKIVADSVDVILAILRDEALPLDEQTRAFVNQVDAKMLHDILPKYAKAGDIRTYFNVDVKDLEKKHVAIEKVGIETDLYGLTFSGALDVMGKQFNVDMHCTTCDALLTDVADYANALNALAHKFGISPVEKPVTEEGLQAIIAFIKQYDANASDDAITLALKTTAPNQMTISGKPIGMFIMQAMTQVGPHFQHILQHHMQ